jgi:S1-C subfamily serine protease
LYRKLDLYEVGDSVRVTVIRDQKTLEVTVTLQALPTVPQ